MWNLGFQSCSIKIIFVFRQEGCDFWYNYERFGLRCIFVHYTFSEYSGFFSFFLFWKIASAVLIPHPWVSKCWSFHNGWFHFSLSSVFPSRQINLKFHICVGNPFHLPILEYGWTSQLFALSSLSSWVSSKWTIIVREIRFI